MGKNLLLTTLCAFLLPGLSPASANPVSEKLPATKIIGTQYSVDYDNNNAKTTTVNTKAKAFDGDFNTYFASYDRIGTWVGLDLGEKHIITKVAFCPRADWNSRVVLGVFEGANNPDFGDAIPLHIIADAPAYNKMTEATVSCSRGFRYVRYIAPMGTGNAYSAGDGVRCNIAELAFYGYKGEGDDSNISPLTNIPAVVIHTTDAEDVVVKEKYLKGIVTFISADGKTLYSDSTEIKGRGNASWGFPKKPYRLKLYSKTDKILGNPAKAKNWTLINNFGDKTLMRNLLAFDLSKRYEMAYTPAGQAVNVFLNGDYKGCYQLCDHIEVNEAKVNIKEMKETDVSGDKLTGGYLIEIDQYAYEELPEAWFRSNRYTIPVTIKSPKDDEIVPQQHTYIKNYFELFLTSLLSSNYTNATTGYRKYLDTESFIKHFLIGELSGNTDTYWSTYMYKNRGSEQFFTGPVWDFDIAYDNDYRTYPINNLNKWIYEEKGSHAGQDTGGGGARAMVNRLFSDPAFLAETQALYAKYRDNKIITEETLLKVVDDYAAQLQQSQKLNFTRWNIMNQKVHMNPYVWGNYDAEIRNVKNYIKSRIAWMDKKLNYVPSSIKRVVLPGVYVVSAAGSLDVCGVEEMTLIQVYDSAGKKIHSSSVNSNTSIPLSSGFYLVQIQDEQGGTRTVKSFVR